MLLSKREGMFTASMLLLIGEFVALTTSLIILWKTNLILYLDGVIVQQVGGIFTTSFFLGLSPPPTTMMLLTVYEGAKTPVTWILVPFYMAIKPVLLSKIKINEVRATTFVPLIYFVERYLTFPWFSSSVTPGILPQGGFGMYCLLLGLLLGAFSTSYFSSTLLGRLVETLWTKLKEGRIIHLKELAKEVGYSERAAYTLLSDVAMQGVLSIVVTPENVYSIDSEEGKRAVIAVFNEALLTRRRLKINKAKGLMKKYNVYFTKDKEKLAQLLLEAIGRGEIKGKINGKWLEKFG